MRPVHLALRAALLALMTLGLVACESPTEASRRIYSDIFDIEVPSAVRAAAVSVAVWQPMSNEQVVCQGIFPSARTEVAVPPEARAAGPTAIRFRQASGPDSVRVVSTPLASTHTP